MQKFLRTLALLAFMLVPWVTQAQQALPYSYGFEDNDLSTDGWLLLNASSSGISSSAAQSGSYGFRFDYSEDNDATLVSPVLTGTTNGVAVSFAYKEYSADYGDEQFYVGYTTDETVTDPDDFTYGEIITASLSWQQYENTFPAGTKRIAIKYVYNDAYYLYLDDFNFEAPASCTKPTGLAVNYAGGTEATISWTSEATAWNISVNGVETAITTNPYTLTNLSLSTTYEVMVQADCGSNGTSNWTNAISFTTPDCWGGHLISYTLADQYGDGWNGAAILVKDACGNVVETITIDNGSSSSGSLGLCGEYYEFVWQTGSYDGECSFTFTEGGSTLFSDISSLPYTLGTISCPAPTDLTTDELTTSTAVLSWTENGTATAWQLCVNGDEDHLIDVTTNPYTLNNLDEYTPYTVKLRANCGESQSCWTDDFDFTTLAGCPAPELAANGITNITAHTADVAWTGFPADNSYVVSYRTKAYLDGLTEEFSTSSPAGWLKRTGVLNNDGTATLSGSSSWSIGNNSGVFDYHPYLNLYSTKNYWLISPSMTIGNNYALTFDVAYTKYNSSTAANMGCPTHRFVVLISTDEMATWTILREWNNNGSPYVLDDISYTGETVSSIDLSAYAGQNAYIAFFAHSETNSYDNNFHFDNVKIGTDVPAGAWMTRNTTETSVTLDNLNAETQYEVNVKGLCANNAESLESATQSFTTDIACPAPTDLATIGEPTTNSVKLSWTENGSATAWQLCINDDEENPRAVDANPYTLTGLNDNTTYTVKVRANCGGIDGVSEWSNEVEFTTLANCLAPVVTLDENNVTAHDATINWTGNANTYTIIIGEEDLAAKADFETGNLSQAAFTTTTNYPFTVVENTQSGAYCAKSGNGGADNTTSDMVLEVTVANDATLTFVAKVSSESGWDKAYFSIDGTVQSNINGISGNGSWISYTYVLTAGTHTLRWYYSKDSSGNTNDDCFYVDDILISAGVSSWDDSRTTNATTYTFDELEGETSYQVKVVGECPTGTSDESNIVSFTTGIACFAPTALHTVSDPTINSVELGWTAGADETAWQLCVNGDENNLIDVTTNPYTLTELTDNTTYTVKVRANCGGIDGVSTTWSNEVEFTTEAKCPVLTDLAITDNSVTTTTAGVEWNQGSEKNLSYIISYRTKAYIDGLTEEFSGTTLPSGWLNRSGLLSDVMNGTALGTTSQWAFGSNNGVFDNHARINIYGTGRKGWLISPEIVLPDGAALNFDLALTAYSGTGAASGTCDDDRFVVLAYANDQWNILREWNNSGSGYVYNDIPLAGENVSIDLSAYAGQAVQIAFYGESTVTGNGDNNLHIDNLAIGTPVPAGDWATIETTETSATIENLQPRKGYEVKGQSVCALDNSEETEIISFTTEPAAFAPTTLTAENITATGATLTWEADESNNGTETYSVVLNGQTLTAETTPAAVINGTTATITGMTANTNYVFGVKALNLGDESEAKKVFLRVNEYPTEPGKMVSLYCSYSWSNTATPSVSFYYGMGETRAAEAALTRTATSATYNNRFTFTNTESNDWVNNGPVTVVFLNHNANAIDFAADYPQISYVCPAIATPAAEEVETHTSYTWAIADANFSETYTNHAEGTLVNGVIEYTVIPDAAYRTYQHVVKNVADCDSVNYTLNLTLHPDYVIEVADEICERDTYTVTDGTTTEEFTATTNTVVTLHSASGADSVINLSLQMHPAPVATINSRTENTINDYCEGKALELVAGSNMTGVSYVWNNDDQLIDGTITVEPADATNVYTLVATDNTYNCASLPATLTVNTTPVPALSISGDAEVCAGQSVTLTVSDANNVPATYRWSNGQTGTSITVTPAQTTTYTVTATTETTNCEVTAEHTVTVNALPVVELSTSTTALCSGSALTLTATENNDYTYSWSTGATTAVVELNPTVGGAYTLTVTDQNNCVNEFTTANITVYPVYNVNAERSACQEMLPITWGDNTINGEGEFDYTFESVNGCDSAVHLTFSIEAMPTENSFAEYCEGAEFNWGGTTYTATAELAEVSYIDNSNTCPVNKVQHLTVYPVKATTVPMTVCDAYTWTLTGDEYTQSGDYQKTLATVHGCDSVVTLALTVNYKNEGVDQQTHCDQYTWIDGQKYTESNNTATFTLEGANVYGCDSTVTLNLTVNYTTYGTDFHCVTTDRSFTWIDGVTYNTSIAPDANITKKLDEPNAAGCDSIAVLSLVLNPVTDTLPWVNRTECDNFFLDVVTFNDETCESSIVREYISESGQVERRTRNAETGRDQWTRINLTIRNSEHKTVRLSECVPYTWYPQDGNTELKHVITSDTILSQEVENEFGCYIIKVLRFTAKYPTEVTVTDAICQGTAEYSIRDWSTVTSNLEAGEYEYTVPTTTKNAAGCAIDSTLVLTINPVYNVVYEPVLCESQFTNNAYTYVNPNNAEESVELHIMALNGQPYTGTEYAYWSTAAGCDSIVTINYTVNPTLTENIVMGVCEPYTWDANGHEFTEFGDYTDQVTNTSEAYGCDSITTLNLSYYDKAYGVVEVIECGSYTYKGVTYRDGYVDDSVASGQSVITNCDSVTVFRHVIKQRQLVDQYVLTNKDYQWINGRTYTESVDGVYYVASAPDECDSVVVLHLTIAEPIVICENEMPYTTQYDFVINPVLGDGSYNGVYERTNGRGNDTVMYYTVNRNTAETVTITNVCDSYTWTTGNGQTYDEDGNYEWLTANLNGCDSTVTLALTLNHSNAGTTSDEACGEYIWTVNSFNTTSGEYEDVVVNATAAYTESGEYTYTATNAQGCDSVITLTLTINPVYNITENIVACDSYEWKDGDNTIGTYTESTVANHTFASVNGCDSVVTLNITINNSVVKDDEYIENRGSYTYNNVLYNAPYDGIIETLVEGGAANHCDSTYRLHLIVNNSTLYEEVVVNCGDYTWRNGKTYTWVSAGERVNPIINYKERTADGTLVNVYEYPEFNTYKTDGSIDSTYILQLTLQEAYVEYRTVDVLMSRLDNDCNIEIENHVFNFAAQKAAKQDVNGLLDTLNKDDYAISSYYCDSIIYYTFNLKYNYDTVADIQYYCYGDAAAAGKNVDEIFYVDNVENAGTPEEMVMTTKCIRNRELVDNVTLTACDSIEWNGAWRTGDDTYQTTKVLNGITCDSVVNLTLTVINTQHNVDTEVKCQSELATFTWNGKSGYTESVVDTFKYQLPATGECWNVDTLKLTVKESYNVTTDSTRCDVFVWNGVSYTTTGEISQNFTAANDCDSTVTINLTINNSFNNETEPFEISEFGDNYRLNGQLFSAPYDGTVYFNLTTEKGCDSIAYFHVVLNHYQIVPVMVTDVCGEYKWENAQADDGEYVGNGHVYRSITDEEAAGGALYRDVTDNNALVYSNPLDTNDQTGKIYSLQLSISGAVFNTDAVQFLVSRGVLEIDATHSFDYTALQQTFAGTKVVNETLHYDVTGACDSIVDLTVTLVNNYDTLDDVYVCNDQTTFEWTEADETLDLNEGSNEFTRTLNDGTDDEMVTTRTIIRRAAITGTQTLVGCDSVQWNNTWYFANNSYEPVTLVDETTGCDSVVTLINNITTTIHNVTELTECDTYTWTAGNGETYTASTVGEWSRANAENAQCFDVDTLKLTINTKSNGVDEQHGCDSYTWTLNGETYTADENEANVTLTGANMYGCDSIVTLNLTMGYSNSYDSTLWVSDGSYRYQKQDGTYEMLGIGEHIFTENYTNVSGCDSALNITIKVGNGYFKAIDTIACDHFTWINGVTYQWISAEESAEHNNALYKTTDGEYITSNPYCNVPNKDDNGVTIDFDSIFMLRLTLNQNVESEDVVDFPVSMGVFTYGNLTHDYTLTYDVNNAPVFEDIEDHYDVHFDNPRYCDSIVHLTVNVYNNFVADPTVDLCAGVETYTAFNQTIDLDYEDYDNIHTYYIYDAIDENNEVHYVTVVQHPISYTTERRYECDSYEWNGRTYTESTSGATVNLEDRFGCDSTVTLTLTIYNNTNTVTGSVAAPVESCESYVWTLANGETYTLTESGSYRKEYTASAAGNCPSVDSVYLVINHSSPVTTLDNVEACDSYTWEVNTFNGTEYETVVAGTYTANTAARETRVYEDVTYTAKNQYGCDSVITIPMITVKSSQFAFKTETVCDEFVWNNAATSEEEHYYTTNSDLELHTLTVEGCDSLVYMNLTVVKSGQTLAPVTVCDSLVWNDLTLTESGQYYKVTPTTNICETFTDTLNLTVNYGSYNAETVVTCNSYTWINGVTYDEPGTITVVYDHNGEPNAAGCPQVDTLHLTIGEGLVIKVDSAIACLPYTWVVNDSVIGTYSESIETSVRMPNSLTGCDSIVYLVLTMVDKPEAYETATICASELPYTWRGQILEEAGKAEYVSHFDETCDSVYHFTLTVNPTYDIQLTADVCLGQGYNENNFNITAEELPAAGEYTFTQNLTSINDCDSIVTLTVTVGDVIEHLDEVTECNSYEWTPGNGETYTYDESGNYEVTYTNAGGCVSIDKLQLTINNSQTVALDAVTACDSYEWNGETYTESGELIFTTTGANGCDSTTTVVLTVNNSQTVALEAVTACDSYEWNGETYTESAELIYTTTGANNCDSTTTLSLTINNSQTVAEAPVTACDSYEWNGETYTESGELRFTTTGANNCDSTTTLALTIKNSVNTEFSDSECLFYVWNSQAYTESGDYQQTFEAANGCDSIVTLHLTINQPVTTEITETACDSYDWNNANYSISGDYQQTFTAANGCDSIVTLHLTVVNHIDAEVSATACGSYIWADNNNTEYTESGDYTRDITDVNNCAAIETLHLTIIEQPVDVTVTETVCDEYLWDVTGEVYTESGVYTHELNNQGCVATATLNLTVNESVTETINVTACGSYTWNDVTYTESTIVSYEGETGAGCDSIVTLILTINNPVYNTVYETACNSYTWNNGDGMTYTESGSYTYTIEQGAANGCDSIVTLNLTINNAQTVVLDAIAACDSYEWNGVIYTEGGELSYTTTGTNGCDSTTTVVLTINNSQTVALDAVATCNSFEWNGTVYTESGELNYTTQDVNGCDSTTTLSLTINGAIYSIDEQNACDSYTWIVNDEVIGTYTASTNEPTAILPAASGCDSIVTLNLTIRNSSTGVFEATACDSYTWALNGVSYTESNNTDAVTLVNVAGCDSTVTLNLTVNHSTEGEINVEAYDYYTWYGVTYTETPAEAPTHMFTNAAGCDSTLILNLTILHYDSITVILSVNDPVMGTTNPVAGTYRFYPGERVSATATPNGGYLFTGWVVNGDTASFANDVYIDVLPEMAGMTFNVVATFKADNVGIESVDYSNISIYSVDNKVIVKGAEGLTIYFYDVNGRCIERRANAAEIENFTVETSGVFLVKAGNAPAKRIVVIR